MHDLVDNTPQIVDCCFCFRSCVSISFRVLLNKEGQRGLTSTLSESKREVKLKRERERERESRLVRGRMSSLFQHLILHFYFTPSKVPIS